MSIFQKVILRPHSPIHSEWSYSKTQELLSEYSNLLNPWYNFWPDYSSSNYDVDNLYVRISKNKLISVWEKLSLMVSKNQYSVDKESVDKVSKEIYLSWKEHKSLNYTDPTHLVFSKNKTLLVDEQISPKDLYKLLIREASDYEALVHSLQSQFVINKDTAKEWVSEYFKYLWILVELSEKSFPSRRVELVWHTHMSFPSYRRFWKAVFKRTMIYPHHYHLAEDWNDDIKKYYQDTLSWYKTMFWWEEPNISLWETAELRFNLKYEGLKRLLSVNLYRLCLMYILEFHNNQILEQTISLVKLAGRSTLYKTQLWNKRDNRSDCIKSKTYYLWRKKFPHCNNIYSGFIADKDENIFASDNTKQENIFRNGGLVVVKNPFKVFTLQASDIPDYLVNSFPKSILNTGMSDFTLDDIADTCYPVLNEEDWEPIIEEQVTFSFKEDGHNTFTN